MNKHGDKNNNRKKLRASERARLDLMANVANHISDNAMVAEISKQIEQARSEGHKEGQKAERQRCIQAISQDSFIREVKNRLKEFAIYETDYQIKMIVREVIYKLSSKSGEEE